jgi:mRNA deadenylase 3'-5' endonuclease subunit Ccr4
MITRHGQAVSPIYNCHLYYICKSFKSVIMNLEPEEAVRDLSLHNPVAMESACGTPPFTNYTSGFSGCLDYIFFEKSKLVVEQVVY